MGLFQLILFLLFCSFLGILATEPPDVTVIIGGSETVAQTDDDFICATLDWWPPEKCNYNQCPWGSSSILNLNLNQPYLAKAIQAFKPLRIRIGGSLQDQVDYGVPSLERPCLPFSKAASGLFGFSGGCLSMARWDELNLLFKKTGAVLTFGLNALQGRYNAGKGAWAGSWNSTNARDFIQYTVANGYPVDSWEFGNELSGQGIGASVGAQQYGKDLISLKGILDELYSNSPSKPLLLAPGGFYDQQWYSQLLEVSGPEVLDALTHHVYNLGGGDDPRIANKILDPSYLDGFANTFRGLQLTIRNHGPWSSAWVGEAGGAYNSGSRRVSNTFLNSFWYLDQLGMAAKYDTKAYCRQTLIGGNYGLLDTQTFTPNPDYYSALLWHRLMGKGVLSVNISGASPHLRAYAHCRKQNTGVTLLLINLSRATWFRVAVRNDINFGIGIDDGGGHNGSFVDNLKRIVSWVGRIAPPGSAKLEEYHLTAKDGSYLGRTVMLNGTPLQLTSEGDIPALDPVLVDADSHVSVAPLSIAFVAMPRFEAQACQ